MKKPPRSIAPRPGAVSTAGRWRRLPEERPGHILIAALDAFVENGFAATRLEDVAERAGISKGTLYLYFDSKEALLTAVVRENVVPFVEAAERRVAEFHGSSRDLLVELVRGWWTGMHESRMGGLPKLVLAEAANFPEVARIYFDEVVQRVRGLFAGALRRGIERGEFRPVDVDYTVRVVMAPVVMGLIWKHSLVKCQIDDIDFDRHLNAIIDIVLHGLVKDPEPRS
ncbi:MAG: TetR/AcrR family transcriptional regulator [Candidatus Eisenbacteria bacterium]|nr:TetR/AcrR family transcriptional regulator [Candidatus Eisenbacteria bacterium]